MGKHPTWYPQVCPKEYIKNGLDWWAVRRDIAQTDEDTPVYARTALAKKCAVPLWYNEWYSKSMETYHQNVWRYALAGGRLVYHPPQPEGGWEEKSTPESSMQRYRRLVGKDLMRAECRVRMLNFISSSPIDCPAAVIFGHASLMNWAGPDYDDCGIDLAYELWNAGYPTDLIPSSEIASGSLKIAPDGAVQYGSQRYRAVILVNPEFEDKSTADFFRKADTGKTALFRVGDWTCDFNCQAVDGAVLLPSNMDVMADKSFAAAEVVKHLRRTGEPLQAKIYGPPNNALPGLSGRCRLIDGTWITIAADKNITGDLIQGSFQFDGQTVDADAVGVLAVRFDERGNLEALAAGGLRSFRCSGLSIELEGTADLALWRGADNKWHGALQGEMSSIPAALAKITSDWCILAVPPPPEKNRR